MGNAIGTRQCDFAVDFKEGPRGAGKKAALSMLTLFALTVTPRLVIGILEALESAAMHGNLGGR